MAIPMPLARSSATSALLQSIHREIDVAVAEMEARQGYGRVECHLVFGSIPGSGSGGHVLGGNVQIQFDLKSEAMVKKNGNGRT